MLSALRAVRRFQPSEDIKKLRQVLADAHRPPAATLVREAIRYGLRHRELPRPYFSRLLYLRDRDEQAAFLSDRERLRFDDRHAARDLAPLLNNKLLFQLHAERAGLPLPHLYGYNLRHVFYDTASPDPVELRSPADLAALFARLGGSAPECAFFLKPQGGRWGLSAEKVTPRLSDADAERLLAKMQKEIYVVQACVVQHPDMAAVSPHSVNTLRMLTVLNPPDEPVVVCVTARFGTGESVTDNAMGGSVALGVDLGTGRLGRFGYRTFKHGGDRTEHHPTTGVRFEGLRVPFFPDAVALACRAARLVPAPFVGWDVAVTPGGPVLIEGNAHPGLDSSEMPNGGLKRHPAFLALLDRLGVRS